LERLIEEFEEGSSQMDVARTSVRKTERIVVKVKSEDLIENPFMVFLKSIPEANPMIEHMKQMEFMHNPSSQ